MVSVLSTAVTGRVAAALIDGLWGTLLGTLGEVTGIGILGLPFMQRAYLAAICVAVIGPLVGSFLVHREMAMIGDTLAHSAFAGVAAGLFVNTVFAFTIPPLVAALVVAAVAAVAVQTLIDYVDTYRDASLAIVLTGSFAISSVLITATDGGIAVGINAYLFGSLATVSRANATLLAALTLVVVTVVAVAYRPLLYTTFDEVGARAAGLHVARYNRLLAVLTAVGRRGAARPLPSVCRFQTPASLVPPPRRRLPPRAPRRTALVRVFLVCLLAVPTAMFAVPSLMW